MNRSYARLEIRAIDEDMRVLTGIATSPTPDRLGDVIEPLGVKFKNPLPLLWQHDSKQPVGTTSFNKPTKEGVTFKAKIAKISEPGNLKDRTDEAWQSVKEGLVRAVSIGFRPIEYSFMDDGGIHFQETEVIELSLVTIPANTDATIETIKSIDSSVRSTLTYRPAPAASGQESATRDRKPLPGVSGQTKPKANLPKEAKSMKTIAEQISAFEASRAAKHALMTEIMTKAADANETLDNEQSDQYDTLEVEIKKIDEHLVRLRALERTNKAQAVEVPAVAATDHQAATRARSGVITLKANVPPEIPFVRYAMALMAGKGIRTEALDIARSQRHWHNTPEVELALSQDVQAHVKAAVGALTTTDATAASPLIAYQQMASEFISYLHPLTIIGRIPGLRRVPFNIQVPRATSGSTTGWVGEQAPKPVSSIAFDSITLRWAKAASIIVLTEELVRFSNPSAEAIVRQEMVDSMTEFLDKQFVDPTVAAVTNVSPASITNGVSASVPSGTTASAFRADVKTLFANFINANLPTAGGVWIMHSTTALSLSLMQNSLGQQVFQNMSPEGGTLLGYPVVVSQNIPATGGSPTDGYPLIFALAREILLADDGQATIDASREASLQLDTAPDSPPTASTNMVSLWQTNHVGLRAERFINWVKRRSTAVQYISNAKYAE